MLLSFIWTLWKAHSQGAQENDPKLLLSVPERKAIELTVCFPIASRLVQQLMWGDDVNTGSSH